ncbi:MAG: hypothetical protein HUJ16_10440 [Kangiella sp.]|nr:hypothetical protein [Kangiella sp.]
MKEIIFGISLALLSFNGFAYNSDGLGGNNKINYSQSNLSLSIANAENYPSHVGSSPTSYEQIKTPSDTFIVADYGPDNDKYTFRDDTKEYDLTFELKIKRYVGDREKLVQHGLMSSKAKIYIPTYDIDPTSTSVDCDGDDIDDSLNPEVDEVYFNGKKIGVLSGGNQVWDLHENVFEVDIAELNLPEATGDVASNLVQIKIDTANRDVQLSSGVIGCKQWAAEIDYVALDFEVVSPVMLVAGLTGNAGAWGDSRIGETLAEYGIPSEILDHSYVASTDSCDVNDAVSYSEHAMEIKEQMTLMAHKYGTSKFNVFGHSKAGMDIRALVNDLINNETYLSVGLMDGRTVKNQLTVNSIATFGTPHKGTSIADAIVANRLTVDLVDGAILTNVYDICDLRVVTSRLFTEANPYPEEIKVLTIGADSDSDKNGSLDDKELKNNQVPQKFLANLLYRQLRDVYQYTREIGFGGHGHPTGRVWKYTRVMNPEPQLNDTMVTLDSATNEDADKNVEIIGNHKTIILKSELNEVWTGTHNLIIEEALNGILGWRVEE